MGRFQQMWSNSWLYLLTLMLRSPKGSTRVSGVISERDWLTQGSRGMLFLKLSQAQAIRTVFEDIMRIQMAPDFLSARSVHCVSLCTFIFLSVCYLISTIIDFCIPGPMSLWNRFSYTDRLINLKVFIATSVIRGKKTIPTILECSFVMQLSTVWILVIIIVIKIRWL